MFNPSGIKRTKSFKPKRSGLSSKIRYFGFVADGILANTDGSLMSSFKFRGIDYESSTDEELVAASARINQALKKLDFGFVLHIDSRCAKATKYIDKSDCYFTHPTPELIDEERRYLYEKSQLHFENSFVFSITWLPPKDLIQGTTSIFFRSRREKTGILIDEAVESMNRQISNLTGILSRCFTQFERMNSQEMLNYLHTCITGVSHDIKIPKKPIFLQSILGSKDYITDSYPKIGNKHIHVVSVYDFPEDGTVPAMLDILNNVNFEYRWVTRFIYVKKVRALSFINKIADTWSAKRKGIKGWIASTMDQNAVTKEDRFAMQQEEDANEAYAEIASGNSKMGFYTNTIVIMDEDEELAVAKAQEISDLFGSIGFTSQIETLNAVDAFEGTWPGYSYENVRKPALKTLNLADLMPTTAIWTGSKHNECRFFANNNPPLMLAKSKGSAPFRVNLHDTRLYDISEISGCHNSII